MRRPILLSALALFAASDIHAAIIYTDLADVSIDNTYDAVSVQFGDGRGSPGFATTWFTLFQSNPTTEAGLSLNFYWHDGVIVAQQLGGGGFVGMSWEFSQIGVPEVDRLSVGQTIPLDFNNDLRMVAASGNWALGAEELNVPATGYIGARFYANDPFELRYGWIRATYAYGTLTLHDMAYDSTGAFIAAGAIPEPSAFILFVAGLVPLLFRRRSLHP
jgi:hypothetical protein